MAYGNLLKNLYIIAKVNFTPMYDQVSTYIDNI